MYPPATLARLRSIKQKYDPTNLFHHNHNVTPAAP
jgi:FAD/FMN-containing dehydrogenase